MTDNHYYVGRQRTSDYCRQSDQQKSQPWMYLAREETKSIDTPSFMAHASIDWL